MMVFRLVGAPIALYKLFSTGAEKAPEVIRKELNINFPDLRLNNLTQERANAKIKKKSKEIFNFGDQPFFIGGDHSITLPILEAYNRPFDVFWFDAHPDAYDFFKHHLSHATVMRRISENQKCKNIYLIGCRERSPEEREFLRSCRKVKRIKLYEIKKIHSPRYYITFDIDVLDPKDAPGVDHAEEGGLKIEPVLREIKRLKKGNLIGADLVEVVPDNDSSGTTVKNAVKIIKSLLS